MQRGCEYAHARAAGALMEGPVAMSTAPGPGAIGRSNMSVAGAGTASSCGPAGAAPGLSERPSDASARRTLATVMARLSPRNIGTS